MIAYFLRFTIKHSTR